MDVIDIRHITIAAAEVVEVIERDLREHGRIGENQVVQSVAVTGEKSDLWGLKLYVVNREDAT